MTGLLETGGVPTVHNSLKNDKASSPRRRGIRQGLFMFLLTFVIAPIVGLISQFGLGIEPWPVGVVIFALGIGGLLRIAYALMFESKTPLLNGDQQLAIGGPHDVAAGLQYKALPDLDPRSEFRVPRSRHPIETNDLQPPSVTDSTTKLLEKDRQRD